MGLTNKTNYTSYTLAYKIKAVKATRKKGVKSKDVARSLGIHPVMLYRWRQEFKEGRLSENKHMKQKARRTCPTRMAQDALKSAERRVKELEKKLANKEEEIIILKKAKRFFSGQHKRNTHS